MNNERHNEGIQGYVLQTGYAWNEIGEGTCSTACNENVRIWSKSNDGASAELGLNQGGSSKICM